MALCRRVRLAVALTEAPDRFVNLLMGRCSGDADRHRRLERLCGLRKRGYDHHAIAECGIPK